MTYKRMLIKYSEKFNINFLTEIYENKSSLRGFSVEESLFSSSSLSLSLPFSPPFLRPNPPHFREETISAESKKKVVVQIYIPVLIPPYHLCCKFFAIRYSLERYNINVQVVGCPHKLYRRLYTNTFFHGREARWV